MIWEKLGLLYAPQTTHPQLQSHAANPLAVQLDGDVYRVFYSGRDAEKRSSVSYVDIDIIKRQVVHVHPTPIFSYGPDDSFYSHGVSIGNRYTVDGQHYLLFMGWQIRPDAHWRGDIGRLKLSADLATLELDSAIPLMTLDQIDPISLSYPWVEAGPAGIGFRMWYGSTHTWDAGNGEMIHPIHYATSADGHHWQRHGLSIPFEVNHAQAFSRPAVVTAEHSPDGRHHMWFSCRSGRAGEKYGIGHASSVDGLRWELRNEQAGIATSPAGWDSEMIEYPFVFRHEGEHYLLYNGNGYGQSGFGLAILRPEKGENR
jgi:hypothetical protein